MKTKKRKRPYVSKREKVKAITGLDVLPDPRQAKFLALYLDTKSPTFCNARGSAISAGFSEEYADNILSLMPKWLSESLGSTGMVAKAEAHLQEVLSMPIEVQAMGAFGPIYEKKEIMVKKTYKNGKTRMVKGVKKIPVMTINTSRVKEKTKVAEIALEAHMPGTYGKSRGPKLSFTFNAAGARARYST